MARLVWFVLALVGNGAYICAQGTDGYLGGLKIKFNQGDEKRYLRIFTNHQFWLRYGKANPGSLVEGQEVGAVTDVSIHRSRLTLHAQINDDFLILTTLGMNDGSTNLGGYQSSSNSNSPQRPTFYVHDALVQYRVFKNYLQIGGGLHMWQGPSRMSGASTYSFLALDAVPMQNWQNIELNDQFARQLGLYAKGQALDSKLDYRFAVNFPFAVPAAAAALDTVAARHGVTIASYRKQGLPKVALTGYVKWQFWDVEDNTYPYQAGDYAGTKEVLNLGTGFYFHPDAMWRLEKEKSGAFAAAPRNQTNISADVFLSTPITANKKFALTVYALYNYMYYGENFVRNIGVNNFSTAISPKVNNFNGPGNSLPTVGTGHGLFLQAGITLPPMGKFGRLQPYAFTSLSKYDRIRDTVIANDFGINWLFRGHSAKITFACRTRPVFKYADFSQKFGSVIFDQKKIEFITQLQIYL